MLVLIFFRNELHDLQTMLDQPSYDIDVAKNQLYYLIRLLYHTASIQNDTSLVQLLNDTLMKTFSLLPEQHATAPSADACQNSYVSKKNRLT